VPPASTTTTTAPAPPATSVPAPPPPRTLQRGVTGPDVLALEKRLTDLGFWLGTPDAAFDTLTAHAVVAFQKTAGLPRDGVVGPITRGRLDAATRPRPRTTSGRVLEVDLGRQVMFVANSGTTVAVLDISSGRGSRTPTGVYRVTHQIDGYHRSSLGLLYRPKYFYKGIAVHGSSSVPPYPASHGCVRTTNAGMDWLWSSGALPVGTVVSVYR
jgi:peptidoglycan hydrolase-like protein with peptidoglycan-binding domain